MLKKLLFFCIIFIDLSLSAQDYFPKNDGVKSKNTNFEKSFSNIFESLSAKCVNKYSIKFAKFVVLEHSPTSF